MKKRFLLVLIILLFIFVFGFFLLKNNFLKQSLVQKEPIKNLEALIIEPKPEIESKGAISFLIRNNQEPEILFEKNIDKKLPIASLVKLMTAHIVLNYYNLDHKIEISEQVILQPEIAGNLKKGQKLSVKELLFPLLIESSNDAAFALSEIIGQEEFIYLMNLEAEQLGLKNTFFANPSGLDFTKKTQSISFSTIQDLIKFIKYLLNDNKLIWNILSMERIEINGQMLINTNELLNKIPGIVGGKTGWTPKANGSLLLVLETPKGYLINIILGAPTKESRFEEMKKIINWVKNYKL